MSSHSSKSNSNYKFLLEKTAEKYFHGQCKSVILLKIIKNLPDFAHILSFRIIRGSSLRKVAQEIPQNKLLKFLLQRIMSVKGLNSTQKFYLNNMFVIFRFWHKNIGFCLQIFLYGGSKNDDKMILTTLQRTPVAQFFFFISLYWAHDVEGGGWIRYVHATGCAHTRRTTTARLPRVVSRPRRAGRGRVSKSPSL